MKKVMNLDDWEMEAGYTDDERFAEIAIHLKFPDYTTLQHYSPAERKKRMEQHLKQEYEALIATRHFSEYERIGKGRRWTGISTKVPFNLLQTLAEYDFISHIHIKNIDRAMKIVVVKPKIFCVKMTVAVEVEGRSKGMQTYEERLVLVKADTVEDAYDKLDKGRADEEEPYLNYAGEMVRWRIESFDDYHELHLDDFADLDNEEGIEVFSQLKQRRLSPDRVWDGKVE